MASEEGAGICFSLWAGGRFLGPVTNVTRAPRACVTFAPLVPLTFVGARGYFVLLIMHFAKGLCHIGPGLPTPPSFFQSGPARPGPGRPPSTLFFQEVPPPTPR